MALKVIFESEFYRFYFPVVLLLAITRAPKVVNASDLGHWERVWGPLPNKNRCLTSQGQFTPEMQIQIAEK